MSISIMGSEEPEPIFIPVETDTKSALADMIKKMEVIRKSYIQKMYPIYTGYYQKLRRIEDWVSLPWM